MDEQAFGWSVGIDGRTAIVGAHGTDQNTAYPGAAYLYAVVPEPASVIYLGLSCTWLVLLRWSRTAVR